MQVINVPGSITAYSVSFLSPSGDIISPEVVNCRDENCAIDVSRSLCSLSSSITFTVSAMNRFGQGPPSSIKTIGNIHN